jgi:hypothetical protein
LAIYFVVFTASVAIGRAVERHSSIPFIAARVFSLSSDAVRQDARLSESEQNRLAEQYACRAIELLRQTQVTGFFENPARVIRLKKDPDLAPLRSREEFAKLVAESAKKREAAAN